ncbi:MAG: hypothetical protein JO048_00500, partial [Methylobacteriaceae bacterium]|nr:hypothetical protein [Methylobacteriaceae bacterium]
SVAETRGFVRSTILSDPIRELAGTLLQLRRLRREGFETGSWRHLGASSAMLALGEFDLTDAAELGRAVKRLDDHSFNMLANPLVKRFGAKLQDEALLPAHLARALDAIAEFEIIGFDDDLPAYRDLLAAYLERDLALGEPKPEDPEFGLVVSALAQCRPALELVSLDYEFYDRVRDAYERTTAQGV